jgi:hypothetical protein
VIKRRAPRSAGVFGGVGGHSPAVELHVPPGRPGRPYWRSQMENYLLFYAKGWS